MPNVPLVSIVIIFLNADKFLSDAVDSVLAQTFDNWELFLVDDGSTDRSTAIAQSYAERFPEKMRYLEHEGHVNKGMSASRNLGIAQAKGEFVALLDADDIWFPDKLHTQVAILTTHPEAAMVAAPAMNWYADGAKQIQPMTLTPGVLAPGAWIPKILEKDDNTAGPSSVLIRTRALREVGGFEASFKGPLMVFEDQVTWFKMTLASPVVLSSGAGDFLQNPRRIVLRVDTVGVAAVGPDRALRPSGGLHPELERPGSQARHPSGDGACAGRRAPAEDRAEPPQHGEQPRFERLRGSAATGHGDVGGADARTVVEGQGHHAFSEDLRRSERRVS